jgi:very-short-patch-repair endonuclease
MELNNTQYETMTKIELVSICKEKSIKGYAQNGITKLKLIQLLKGETEYKDPRERENWSENKKKSFEKALKKRQLKNNLFDYLTLNNPSIIRKYSGNQDDLKTISHSTMAHYKWKCENFIQCSNVFEARPRDVFRNDSKSPTKYCSKCKFQDRGQKYQQNMLQKNGSIQEKNPNIINVWCKDNKFKPDKLTDNSHKKVKLKCPNKSAKHPDYEISVYNIQESNCYSCPKCSIKTSKAEMRIYSELKYVFKDVKWQQKIEGREADITIEDLKLVIEVDGFPWHMNKTEKDLEKNSIFKKNGYSVLRIRDTQLNEIECDYIICDLSELSLTDYNKIVDWINTQFKCNINVYSEWKNIEYYKEIHASLLSVAYDESVEYLFPESKELWDCEKNHPLLPSHFKIGSNMNVWVKCKSGHSYERPINRIFRIRNNEKKIMNCPDCPKQKSKPQKKRIIEVNGKKYNNITESCRALSISRGYLYQKMKLKGIDIKVIADIQKEIEEIMASKVL